MGNGKGVEKQKRGEAKMEKLIGKAPEKGEVNRKSDGKGERGLQLSLMITESLFRALSRGKRSGICR